MYDVVWTPRFQRTFRCFRRSHPELTERIERTLNDLRDDPLHGELEGQHAVSITQKHRITLTLRIVEREIILLDIGAMMMSTGRLHMAAV
jgi:Txe/YoeB family toxin of Txe-Axe toxin-antitoxin module